MTFLSLASITTLFLPFSVRPFSLGRLFSICQSQELLRSEGWPTNFASCSFQITLKFCLHWELTSKHFVALTLKQWDNGHEAESSSRSSLSLDLSIFRGRLRPFFRSVTGHWGPCQLVAVTLAKSISNKDHLVAHSRTHKFEGDVTQYCKPSHSMSNSTELGFEAWKSECIKTASPTP